MFIGAKTTEPGRVRRITAVLLSLMAPGAGHFLLGRFFRGAAWAVGLTVLGLALLFATIAPLLALVAVVVAVLGHIVVAIDTARVAASRPSWKIVIVAWTALLVGNLAVVEPLKLYYRTYYAQAFTVPSDSMRTTLLVGDYIMVDKSAYRVRAPERGDIVVFQYPQDERRDFIMRIVGTPGDVVQVKGDQVFVNAQPLEEPYIRLSAPSPLRGRSAHCAYANGCEPLVVPSDSYFVMGDHRNNSQDSRYWGFVRRDRIKGRAVTVYWSWDTERQWVRFDRIGQSL